MCPAIGRNGVRLHSGMLSGFKSEYLSGLRRNLHLYKAHGGRSQVDAAVEGTTLDVSCSRSESTLYVHVVNTDLDRATKASISIAGVQPSGAYAHEIAPGDLSAAIDTTTPHIFRVTKHHVSVSSGVIDWSFPKASVTALEIKL